MKIPPALGLVVLALLSPARGRTGASVDLLIQVVDSGAHAAVNLEEDGVPVTDAHSFGVTPAPLTVEVSSMSGVPAIQNVRFEYAKGTAGWTVIGVDSTVDDAVFGVTWIVGALAPGGDYSVRAVVKDVLGNDFPGQTFVNCSVNE